MNQKSVLKTYTQRNKVEDQIARNICRITNLKHIQTTVILIFYQGMYRKTFWVLRNFTKNVVDVYRVLVLKVRVPDFCLITYMIPVTTASEILIKLQFLNIGLGI